MSHLLPPTLDSLKNIKRNQVCFVSTQNVGGENWLTAIISHSISFSLSISGIVHCWPRHMLELLLCSCEKFVLYSMKSKGSLVLPLAINPSLFLSRFLYVHTHTFHRWKSDQHSIWRIPIWRIPTVFYVSQAFFSLFQMSAASSFLLFHNYTPKVMEQIFPSLLK